MLQQQPSTSVHHLFGSRLERHATYNTIGDYSVQFSTVHPSIPATTLTHSTPPPVLVVCPCQSCHRAPLFYVTSPPLPPDFFIKRQAFYTNSREIAQMGGGDKRNRAAGRGEKTMKIG